MVNTDKNEAIRAIGSYAHAFHGDLGTFILAHSDDEKETLSRLMAARQWIESLPDWWPRWNDGQPVIAGQVAVSFIGPLPIWEIEADESGYTLRSRSGYIIDQGRAREQHPNRVGEYQFYWPGIDDNPDAHDAYFAASGYVEGVDGYVNARKQGRILDYLVNESYKEHKPEFYRRDAE